MNAISAWDMLEAARQAVPALDYALGAVGVAAAGAIIIGLLGKRRASLIVLGGMLVAMVLVFVFSRLVAAQSLAIVYAGIFLLWTVVLFFSAFLVFTATAVALRWPRPWAVTLGLEASRHVNAGLEELRDRINLADGYSSENAIAALLGIALVSSDAKDIETIVAILKDKLRRQPIQVFDATARGVRRSLVRAILRIRKFDIQNDFLKGELSNSDLVSIDFTNVNAQGLDFSKSLLMGADFRGANLRGANFSLTALRNVQFRNADLTGAVFSGADWFNAIGLSKSQIETIVTTDLKKCPTGPKGKYTKDGFVESANKKYAVSFHQWSPDEQAEASASWATYAQSGGLCDFVRAAE